MTGSFVPPDADKLPERIIEGTYVVPPNTESLFSRSTLLIGSRGSGKTFLLRHHRRTYSGPAYYVNLWPTTEALARALGAAYLQHATTGSQEIEAKAACLLLLAVYEELQKAGGSQLNRAALIAVFPASLRDRVADDSTKSPRPALIAEPLDHFAGLPVTEQLPDILEDMIVSDHMDAAPYLLLDRADDVPPAVLRIFLRLLDQSRGFLSVIAARPGFDAGTNLLPFGSVPGDHFNLVHLGSSPYGASWRSFLSDAVHKYLAVSGYPPIPIPPWLPHFARDSARQAIELAQVVAHSGKTSDRLHDAVINRLDNDRKALRIRVAPQLAIHGVDFEALVAFVLRPHKSRLAESRVIIEADFGEGLDPFNIDTLALADPQLSERQLSFLRATAAALRTGGLHAPDGDPWYPGRRLSRFEVPPLLAWSGKADSWID